jgi:folate-binding protein YgfZ
VETTREYRQVHEGAGLVDVSQRGKIEVTGPDAASFLHNMTTNDIRNLPAGAGCEIFLTNAKGKVIAFGWIYHLSTADEQSSFWLDIDSTAAENAVQHLNKYLISEQVEIADRTNELAQLSLVGPKAREILARAMGQKLPDWCDLQCGFIQGPGSLCIQVRFHMRYGVECFEMISSRDESGRISNLLTQAGARMRSEETLEILRVEAGVPAYGIDMDENTLAPEVGRTDKAISYTKGCYLGQETIVRIRDLGHVNRTLLGLRVEGESVTPHGSKIFRDDKEVGEVRSCVLSPRLGTAIGLAYLHRSCQEPGTRVEVTVGMGRVPAEVASLPFWGSEPA